MQKRNLSLVILCTIFLMSAFLWSCGREPSTQKESTELREEEETAEDPSTSYVLSDSTFEFTNFWNEFYSYHDKNYIIKFRQDGLVNVNTGSEKSSFGVQVLDMDQELIWRSEINAHDIELIRDIVLASYEGGNEFEDTYQLFSLQNGKELLSYTNAIMTVNIPNSSDKRFIGFISRKSNKVQIDDGSSLGYLTYASNNKMIEQLEIKVRSREEMTNFTPYTPDMTFDTEIISNKVVEAGKGLIIWDANEDYQEKDISGFKVVLGFFTEENEQKDITIPFKNDRIDLGSAEYNKNLFQIERM